MNTDYVVLCIVVITVIFLAVILSKVKVNEHWWRRGWRGFGRGWGWNNWNRPVYLVNDNVNTNSYHNCVYNRNCDNKPTQKERDICIGKCSEEFL